MQFVYLISDEAMEDCGFLRFSDDTMKATFLQALSTMRKHRLFCDVVLNVRTGVVEVDVVCRFVVVCSLMLWLLPRLFYVGYTPSSKRCTITHCATTWLTHSRYLHTSPTLPILYLPLWHRSRTLTFMPTKMCSPACRPI